MPPSAPTDYFTPGTPLRARLDAFLGMAQCQSGGTVEGGNLRIALALLLADTVRQVQADARAEAQELRTVLDAWHEQFGTTQLSHAVAKQEAALKALQAELAPLREAVGVRAEAVSSPDDLTNWGKLVERADRAFVAEAANVRLRGALASFANPERWVDLQPGLQWFGKRNPMEFATTVLRDTETPRLDGATVTGTYVVEGLNWSGCWEQWYVTEGGKPLNPTATLDDARKLRADLDRYRAEGNSGWRASRIVFVFQSRQIVLEDETPAARPVAES